MPIAVRDADLADPKDGAAIVDLVMSYATDPTGGGTPLAPNVRERMVAGLRAHPTTLVLLAFDDARPVGVAVCFFGFSTFQARPLLNIHDLAVLPDARGRGIGRELLTVIEARARARGCCKLTLEVVDDNRRARQLYASFGLADTGAGTTGFSRFLSKPLAP